MSTLKTIARSVRSKAIKMANRKHRRLSNESTIRSSASVTAVPFRKSRSSTNVAGILSSSLSSLSSSTSSSTTTTSTTRRKVVVVLSSWMLCWYVWVSIVASVWADRSSAACCSSSSSTSSSSAVASAAAVAQRQQQQHQQQQQQQSEESVLDAWIQCLSRPKHCWEEKTRVLVSTIDRHINNTVVIPANRIMARTIAINPRGGAAARNPRQQQTSTCGSGISTRQRDSNENKSKKQQKYVYSIIQEGDGSHDDPDGLPTRYLLMQSNNRPAAVQAFHQTLQWRQQNDIDTLLKGPRTKFDICKAVFPHYFLGRSDTTGGTKSKKSWSGRGNKNEGEGHVVFIQQPAKIDLKLAEDNGLKPEELLMHYVYVNEYLWQVLEENNAMAKMISIIDMDNVPFWVLRKSYIMSFVQKLVSTMDAHYPQRAHKTLVVNVPKWFHMLYQIISPLLRETTKKNIEIHVRGPQQDQALRRWLGEKTASLLEPHFFSHHSAQQEEEQSSSIEQNTKRTRTPDTELERQLRDFTLARIRDGGAKMQPVRP